MTKTPATKNPLALIIEDNEAVGEVFKAAFKHAHFDIEFIRDGSIALDRLAVTTPAIILLDLHLPHVSGQQILNYVHGEERLAKTQIILATADLPRAESLEHEVDFVLVKPFGFIRLHELVKQLRPSLLG